MKPSDSLLRLPVIEITVPGDPAGALSPNVRLHYYERHRRQQDWQHRTWLAWQQAGRPRLEQRCRITWVLRRGRRLDPDNAAAAMKAVLDGLKDQPGRQALLPDDSSQWVEIAPVRFETGQQWQRWPELLIRVESDG